MAIGSPENNLFDNLRKWAKGQDENYTTEALTFLLKHLLERDRVLAVDLLIEITGVKLQLEAEENIKVKSQKREEGDQPDICVQTQNHLVFIEVKVDAKVNLAQLKRYRERLNKRRPTGGTLVLLTRDVPLEKKLIDDVVDSTKLWRQIAEWLEKRLNSINDKSSIFLVDQFLTFLKRRNMLMEQVGRELGPGIQALVALMNQLESALRPRVKRLMANAARDFNGWSFKLKGTGKDCWQGVRYKKPEVLRFEVFGVNKASAETFDFGRTKPDGAKGRGELEMDKKVGSRFRTRALLQLIER